MCSLGTPASKESEDQLRTRLLSGFGAVAVAVVMAVSGTGAPARAEGEEVWIDVAVAVAQSLFGGGGGGSGDLEKAKQEIINAVNASRQEILDHIDAIASADVRACAEAGTLQINQIDAMDDFTLAVFMENAVNCATKSTAYFDAVQNLPAADNIAKLMGEIYSIAMVAFAKVGFTTTDLLDGLIRGYEAVLNKLKPTCETRSHTWADPEYGWYTENTYTCKAFPTDTVWLAAWTEYWYGSNVENPIDYAYVEAYAMRNTARPVVEAALPQLRQARAAA
jgi:hypothetical protein